MRRAQQAALQCGQQENAELRPVRSHWQAPGPQNNKIQALESRHILKKLKALKRSSNQNFVWMIGPERGKPVGAFYSADGNMNPTGTCLLLEKTVI